eukprot:6197978-Pleurochrysis_carterae.AAC.1
MTERAAACGPSSLTSANEQDTAAAAAPSTAGAARAQHASNPVRTFEQAVSEHVDLRGSYDRENAEKRKDRHTQAAIHLQLIKDASLGTPCRRNCPFKGRCGDLLTKNDLYQCHEYSFGVTAVNPKTEKMETVLHTNETQQQWRKLMLNCVSYDANNKASFAFKTASRPTCEDYMRAAYGITQNAWNNNMSLLRKGPGVISASSEMNQWNAAGRAARVAESCTSKSEAIKWWSTMLSMWDAVPNEFVIVHPRLVWDALYVRLCTFMLVNDVCML